MNLYFTNKTVSIRCHLILAVGVLPYVLLYDKTASLMFINSQFSAITDVLMYHVTRLPELAYLIFVISLGLFTEKRMFLSIVLAMCLSSLFIFIFKHHLFTDFDRPYKWLLEHNIPFHHVKGIRLHSNNSFPSGHTLAAFSSLAMVGFVSKNGWVQFFLFLLACISGYSRLYVAQHYLMDVYAGALIGFTLAILSYYFIHHTFKTSYWLQPIIQFKS